MALPADCHIRWSHYLGVCIQSPIWCTLPIIYQIEIPNHMQIPHARIVIEQMSHYQYNFVLHVSNNVSTDPPRAVWLLILARIPCFFYWGMEMNFNHMRSPDYLLIFRINMLPRITLFCCIDRTDMRKCKNAKKQKCRKKKQRNQEVMKLNKKTCLQPNKCEFTKIPLIKTQYWCMMCWFFFRFFFSNKYLIRFNKNINHNTCL